MSEKQPTPAMPPTDQAASPAPAPAPAPAQAPEPAGAEAEVGVQAALRHLRLAIRALYVPLRKGVQPWLARMPRISPGMRVYLLANAVLYTLATVAFLFPSPALRVGRTGFFWVDTPALHVLWGLGALIVSVLQVAALISTRWVIWQLCAVWTAMWASGWGVVVFLMAHLIGNYGGVAVWGWIIVMHLIVIGNRFVPNDHELDGTAPVPRYEAQLRVPSDAADEADHALLERWRRVLQQPSEFERAMLLTRSA